MIYLTVCACWPNWRPGLDKQACQYSELGW